MPLLCEECNAPMERIALYADGTETHQCPVCGGRRKESTEGRALIYARAFGLTVRYGEASYGPRVTGHYAVAYPAFGLPVATSRHASAVDAIYAVIDLAIERKETT